MLALRLLINNRYKLSSWVTINFLDKLIIKKNYDEKKRFSPSFASLFRSTLFFGNRSFIQRFSTVEHHADGL
jgi:hypothetical protein